MVDGHPLKFSGAAKTVVLFHKPRNVMTTRDDPGNRPIVFDALPKKFARFHPVGRLDFDTSGVLLLTDDGELTHLLTHPSHGAEKVYQARVRGTVEREALERLQRGVRLEDGPTAPCRARVVAQREKNALVEITLREGRNRQVRRMLEAVGHPAGALRRVKFAGIELEGLPAGDHRILLPGEVKALRKRVEGKTKGKPAGSGERAPSKRSPGRSKPAPARSSAAEARPRASEERFSAPKAQTSSSRPPSTPLRTRSSVSDPRSRDSGSRSRDSEPRSEHSPLAGERPAKFAAASAAKPQRPNAKSTPKTPNSTSQNPKPSPLARRVAQPLRLPALSTTS